MEQWSKFQGDLILIGPRIAGPETEDTSQLFGSMRSAHKATMRKDFCENGQKCLGTKEGRQDQSNRAVGPSRSGAASQIGILEVGGAS